MARRTSEQRMRFAGRTLQVTNLDKILYPETGTTKGEIIDYYARVAPLLIPHAAWRPATRKRWVDGVGTEQEPAKPFFRKDLEDSAPDWIPTAKVQHKEHTNTYPLVNEPAVLAWMGQVAALELHVPQWRFNRSLEPQNPDRLVLDLDPGPGMGLVQCAQVARLCKELLEDMGLQVYPVTSGSKGIHLYAGLDGKNTSEQISAVAKSLAVALEQDHPDLVVSNMKKSLRTNKVLVDWSQNNAAKTTVCPYSLRGRSRPTVAAPRTWEELEDPQLRHLEFSEVLQRIEQGTDPLEDLALEETAASDRLARYRSMRDPNLTPEPVPQEASMALSHSTGHSAEPIFVIQEHHARRLHWDFRLEHEGVLVSWAVPKGPPLETGINRLAVMTEDHPMEYATFQGSIPQGEYGAGQVEIWDTGHCTIEKWREGKEIIAVLHGTEHGGLGGTARRYVLVNAPGMGDERNWLLQLTKEQPTQHKEAVPGENSSDLPDFEALHPMLASNGSPADIDAAEQWGLEMKWDGYRSLLHVLDGNVRIRSRNGKDLTSDFPELQELATLAPEGAVLDGEVIALDKTGRPSFSMLQRRLSSTRQKAPKSIASNPEVALMLFDALVLPAESGSALQDLTRSTYETRRKRLLESVRQGQHVHIPQAYEGSLEHALETSAELGLEGVVAKLRASSYDPGSRTESWIKIKHQLHQEVVIIGWREGKGARNPTFSSLLMAVPQEGNLQYAGRVGTGFSEQQLRQSRELLERHRRKTPAATDVPATDRRDAVWVTPRYVGEVQYSEQTPDGRLRHPVWRGWRADKDPLEVRWET